MPRRSREAAYLAVVVPDQGLDEVADQIGLVETREPKSNAMVSGAQPWGHRYRRGAMCRRVPPCGENSEPSKT